MASRAKSKHQEEVRKLDALDTVSHKSNTAFVGKARLLAKVITALIVVQILFIFLPQEAQTQEITAQEISRLATLLDNVEEKLTSINSDLASMKMELRDVSVELVRIKEEDAKPKSVLLRLPGMGWFRRRKIGKLYTRSRELANEIRGQTVKLKPLKAEFIAVADELIEKANSRMTALAEAFLGSGSMTQEEVARHLSELVELKTLSKRTREARDKFAPESPAPVEEKSLPTLLSNDPEYLRLSAAILKDEAAEERNEAAKLREKIKTLEMQKSQLEWFLERSEEIRRRAEERDVTGAGIGDILGNDDVETEREIENIKRKLEELRVEEQKREEKADQRQQLAEEFEAKIRGKLKDD